MAWCKTVVTPMQMDLNYCSLGLSHRYNLLTIFCQRIHNSLFVPVFVQDSVAACAAELRLPATDVHVWYVTRAHLWHVGKHVSGRVQLPTGTRSTIHEFTPTSPRPISSSAWFKSGIPRQDLPWWVGKLGDWTNSGQKQMDKNLQMPFWNAFCMMTTSKFQTKFYSKMFIRTWLTINYWLR